MTYDLFISYKSEDYKIASDIRKKLLEVNEKLNIFLSEVTLEKIGNSEYLRVIENSIENSKNMLVVGSNIEHLTSKWVTYEWSLFKIYKLNDKEGFYRNLFLAIDYNNVDVKKLPGTLLMCECIDYTNISKIYEYTKGNSEKELRERQNGYYLIQQIFENMGWRDAVFVTPEKFGEYEKSISDELNTVTIVSHSLIHDAPGGTLFNSVKSNLLKGIKYNYIFLNSGNAYGILRRIYKGHSEECRENLLLEISDDSFWALGNYACVTIYEFNTNRPSEGFLRVLVESNDRSEFPIYLRMSELFVDNIWNCIETYRRNGSIFNFKEKYINKI